MDAAEPTNRHVGAALDDAGFAPPRQAPTEKAQRKKVERRAQQRGALEPLLLRQVRALWSAVFGGHGEGWRHAGRSLTFDAYLGSE